MPCANCFTLPKYSSSCPTKLQQPAHSSLQIRLTLDHPRNRAIPGPHAVTLTHRVRSPRSRSPSFLKPPQTQPSPPQPSARGGRHERAQLTVGPEGGARDGGELAAGVDVLEHGLLEPGEVAVALLEHRLDPVPRHRAQPHHPRYPAGGRAGGGRRPGGRRRGGSAAGEV